jgi:catechol 2,3-dioxygenase-like lactoylglutathione lyase family enzyme
VIVGEPSHFLRPTPINGERIPRRRKAKTNIADHPLTLSMTNLTYIMPCFIVADLKTSVSFYVDKLGFKIRYIGPDDGPFWAIVGRDNISINLKAVAEDVRPIPNHSRHQWAPWDAYISTTEPDKLFDEYRSNNVPFYKPLHDNSDNLKGFEIEDADGYLLFFGRPNL